VTARSIGVIDSLTCRQEQWATVSRMDLGLRRNLALIMQPDFTSISSKIK